jgi:PB1 domain.
MAKVQIRYKDRKEYVPVPSSLDELKIIVKEVFGIAKPLFQYFDEDHELITVDVQLELVEALRFVKETQGFLIVEETNLGGSSLQFIDDLPLLKSQITSEESPNVIQESQILEVCNFMQKKKM